MMSKEKRRVPKLRFPGFTEDWEEYRFNNLLKKNLERNDGKFNSNKTISIARMKYNKLGNGASDESLNNYKVLRFGDVAFEGHENKEFKYGRFVMNDIGDGIMSPRFTALRPIKVLDVEFWKEYINYEPIMQKKLVNSTKKGTMMHELVVDEFLKQEILLPSKEEQQKIGRLLKLQSNIINLHQCKVEHLILKKQALLQKLFPRNGNRYPDFRFPGFTAPWEQRKLGECVDISTGYPFDSQDFNENGEYLVITNGNIQENTPFVLNNVGNRIDLDDSLKKYILDIDDLLITMDGTVGRVAIVVDNKLVLAQRVCRIKSNEPYYIYQLLSKNDFIQSMNKIGHGGTIKHISLSEISEYQAFYPKSQKERIKISSVLTNYDKLITLHQRKLEHLQIQKKSLLQKLFI